MAAGTSAARVNRAVARLPDAPMNRYPDLFAKGRACCGRRSTLAGGGAQDGHCERGGYGQAGEAGGCDGHAYWHQSEQYAAG
jgi:hypothetical protein